MENKKVLSHLESTGWGIPPSLSSEAAPVLTGWAAARLGTTRNDMSRAAVRDICPDCRTPMVRLGACFICPRCGYGGCG